VSCDVDWTPPTLATKCDWLGSELFLRRDDAARLRNEARPQDVAAAEAITAAMALLDAAILAVARARRQLESKGL
jgi:hypothetical protein